jgi:preprotein translocase subunit SecG
MYEKKTFIKSKDIIVLIVIYIVSTFILYYLYNSNKNEQTVKVNYIPEPIETGFNLN